MRAEQISETTILAEAEWQARRRAHEERVRAWTDPHQTRARRGGRSIRCGISCQWSTTLSGRPGFGAGTHGPDVVLGGTAAQEYLRWREYAETEEGVAVSPAALAPGRREFAAWLRARLAAMQTPPALLGWHGLHEWAKVYGQSPDDPCRHQRVAAAPHAGRGTKTASSPGPA